MPKAIIQPCSAITQPPEQRYHRTVTQNRSQHSQNVQHTTRKYAYNSHSMKVIGITGTIGSGKSSVLRILEEMGCPVIDADLEAHRSYARGTRAYREIVAEFGEGILDDRRSINRGILGGIVFASPEARARLNSIVHPATRRRVLEILKRLSTAGHEWAALEATLLIEAEWTDMVDRLWVVAAPDESVIARLHRDRGQDAHQVRGRMAVQMPASRMMEHADDIIYNDGDLELLRTRVEALWQGLSQPTQSRAC